MIWDKNTNLKREWTELNSITFFAVEIISLHVYFQMIISIHFIHVFLYFLITYIYHKYFDRFKFIAKIF